MLGFILLSPIESTAQSSYPTKGIKLIVGFAPGGSTDIIGRIVAQRLGERLGQTVLVENKAGAGGTIGADATAKSAPDGYTLTLGTTSTPAIATGAYSKLSYDPVLVSCRSLVAITPYLLVVNPQVKASTLAEFVALAKAQPGKLNYASAGSGTATHLAMEMLKDAAGIDLVHVPYKGNAPADGAILAGDVQAVFGSMPALCKHEANKIRPCRRDRGAFARIARRAHGGRAGLSRIQAALWLEIAGPENMPGQSSIACTEIVAIVATPEFKAAMDANGAEPLSTSRRRIPRDAARTGRQVREDHQGDRNKAGLIAARVAPMCSPTRPDTT